MDFLVDAAITTARVISEATVVEVIALGKGLFDQLTAAIDCGDYLTDVFRTWSRAACITTWRSAP